MKSKNKTYKKGKETIFLVSILMAIIGLIGNLTLNFFNHSVLLNIVYFVAISSLIIIVNLFYFFKIKTKAIYILSTSIVIISILIAQVLISSNSNFDDIVEKHLLTNILYILITIIISGFIIGFNASLAQFLVLIVFLVLRPLQINLPYVSENLILILPLIIGVFIGISFFIKNLEFFIKKVNEQNIKLKIENKEIRDNIQYAKRIQNTILPGKTKLENYFIDHFVFVKQKQEISNSFYYVARENNSTFFAVVNCKGDSVSGALLTVVVNYSLNKAIKDLNLTSPSQIIKYVNEFLLSEIESINDSSKNVDIVLCKLTKNKLIYSIDRNYLWINRGKSMQELEHDFEPGLDNVLDLEKDDVLYLFTSGGLKQKGYENLSNERKEEMKNLLVSISLKKLELQKQIMDGYWEEKYAKEIQINNLCALVIRV